MENVNAGMPGRALPGVFKRSDPLAPCDKVGDQYKHECYINHAGWLMTVAKNDLRGKPVLPEGQGAKYKSSCFQSIGLMVTNPTWQAGLGPELATRRRQIAAKLCRRFPTAGQKDCVIAGVDNLANFDRLDGAFERFLQLRSGVGQGVVSPAGRCRPRGPDERPAGHQAELLGSRRRG